MKKDVDILVEEELNARLSICEGDDDVSIELVVRYDLSKNSDVIQRICAKVLTNQNLFRDEVPR